MSEGVTSGAEASSQTGLFLIDGGVNSDITSLFLRSSPKWQIILAATVDIFRQFAEEYEQIHGESPPSDLLEREAGLQAIEAAPRFAEAGGEAYTRFRSVLTQYNTGELRQIEIELCGIFTGGIRLTDAQEQQLSNLSDGDLTGYLDAFGIGKENLAFPLLDVGTGLNAQFAQDVLAEYPGERVVSTSMHLHSPNSIMAARLAEIEPARRGELVACNGIEMPFEDDTFRMVVSRNADPYYVSKKDLLASLREKHRVMKSGASAILCPSVCQYGTHDITQKDITPLQDEMDVELRPIPESGKRIYDGDIQNLLVITK